MSTETGTTTTRPAGTRAFIHAALLAASLPVLLICVGVLSDFAAGSLVLILGMYAVGLTAFGLAITGLVKRLAGGAGEVVNLRRSVLLSFALPAGLAVAVTLFGALAR